MEKLDEKTAQRYLPVYRSINAARAIKFETGNVDEMDILPRWCPLTLRPDYFAFLFVDAFTVQMIGTRQKAFFWEDETATALVESLSSDEAKHALVSSLKMRKYGCKPERYDLVSVLAEKGWVYAELRTDTNESILVNPYLVKICVEGNDKGKEPMTRVNFFDKKFAAVMGEKEDIASTLQRAKRPQNQNRIRADAGAKKAECF